MAAQTVKNPPAVWTDLGSIPALGRSPGGRHGNSLQYSRLENPMNRGAWQTTVRGVAKSRTGLSFTVKAKWERAEEEEMVGGSNGLKGHEFEETLGNCEGGGSLVCCSPWVHKQWDRTYRLNDNNTMKYCMLIKSVQFSRSVMADSLRPYGLQKARLPCPSPIPGVYSNSCPSHWWCKPTISPSVDPLLLPPSIFPSIRVFSNESILHIRWPKYWSFLTTYIYLASVNYLYLKWLLKSIISPAVFYFPSCIQVSVSSIYAFSRLMNILNNYILSMLLTYYLCLF